LGSGRIASVYFNLLKREEIGFGIRITVLDSSVLGAPDNGLDHLCAHFAKCIKISRFFPNGKSFVDGTLN
jgi:hypothetical protein